MHFHTDAISKGKFDSHSQKNMYILDSASSSSYQQFTKLKEMVGSFSESPPRSPQSLSFISAIRAPLDLRRSGKKHQSVKLPLSTTPSSFLHTLAFPRTPFFPIPLLHHRKLSLEASAILHN